MVFAQYFLFGLLVALVSIVFHKIYCAIEYELTLPKKGKRTLLIDFDGVIHNNKGTWLGPRIITGMPVFGAIEWLEDIILSNVFDVAIYSSRSQCVGGRKAMIQWLMNHDLNPVYIDLISFPSTKPPAFITIDDRSIQFNGHFPTYDEIDTFKPWNKQ